MFYNIYYPQINLKKSSQCNRKMGKKYDQVIHKRKSANGVNSVVFREIQINIRLSSFIIMTTFKDFSYTMSRRVKGNWYSYIVQFSSVQDHPVQSSRTGLHNVF